MTTADAARCTLEIMIQPPEAAAAEIALSRPALPAAVSDAPMENERRKTDCDGDSSADADDDAAADAEAAAATLAAMSKPDDDSSRRGVFGSLGIRVDTCGVSLSSSCFENRA